LEGGWLWDFEPVYVGSITIFLNLVGGKFDWKNDFEDSPDSSGAFWSITQELSTIYLLFIKNKQSILNK
jgi:hypothetical protein